MPLTVKHNILLVSPTPTHPQDAGNRARIFRLAEQLQLCNCDVYFAYYNMEGGDLDAMRSYWGGRMFLLPFRKRPDSDGDLTSGKSITREMSQIDEKTESVDKWYDSSIEEEIRRLHRLYNFITVWVEYVYLSKVLEQFDDSVAKVIDTHDVFSNRKEMLQNAGITPQWFYTSPESEKIGLSRAHAVIAIKEEEAEFFRDLGLDNVITIGHLLPKQRCQSVFSKQKNLLYVASHNPINIKSWQYFMEEIVFLVKERIPDISINIAGKICECIADSKYYKKLGVVDDLEALYRSTMIAINPANCGTGLKIKTIEPLAFGCPVVTTSVGIGGIEDANGRGVLVGRTPEEFAGHIESLVKSRPYYKQQCRSATQYIDEYSNRNHRSLKMLLSYCENRVL